MQNAMKVTTGWIIRIEDKMIESENYGDYFKYLRCNDIFSGWHLPGALLCHQSQMVDTLQNKMVGLIPWVSELWSVVAELL